MRQVGSGPDWDVLFVKDGIMIWLLGEFPVSFTIVVTMIVPFTLLPSNLSCVLLLFPALF